MRSMQVQGGYYRDPALYDRRSPNWPEGDPWPSPAMKLGVTQYARTVLRHYTGQPTPNPPPPEGWPPIGSQGSWRSSRPPTGD
ncbi:MAG TPA: hypothetical protein VM389_12165 [Phycisphaerae bacterium]|nr:hypothetical protein [Phycisphaerae bacterium]HUU58827.1 hypothetical protein [Phycisphaerae bacterium]